MSSVETVPARRGWRPLLAGVVLAFALGGGAFHAVRSEMVLSDLLRPGPETGPARAEIERMPDVAFIPLEPLRATLPRGETGRQLRLEGHLEVPPEHEDEVRRLMPRIMDVMNSYLRAVEMAELRDPAALMRLRAQMLRRIQVVTGEGRVHDLLVTTFLIN